MCLTFFFHLNFKRRNCNNHNPNHEEFGGTKPHIRPEKTKTCQTPRICRWNLWATTWPIIRISIWFDVECLLIRISSLEFSVRYEGRYWIFHGMFNPTVVDVISHSYSFDLAFLSIGFFCVHCTITRTHLLCGSLFIYIFFCGAHRRTYRIHKHAKQWRQYALRLTEPQIHTHTHTLNHTNTPINLMPE